MNAQDRPLLLVEDSPEDRMATIRAFKKCGMTAPIVTCNDGDQALDYLYRRGTYAPPAVAPRPAMILLDLNLPGTDGREVLAIVKADDALRTIPVVILTTSTDSRDVDGSYTSGASSYVRKPVDMDLFVQTMQRLKDWWFESIVMPVR